ncbi:MAG TPA: hypothetical protein VGK32_15635 [Vicinamibacterales bacterium]|jgi:hypothetical protein
MKPWRRLALTAACILTVGAGIGTAQTVIVRHAPPGSAVEIGLNAKRVATGTVDASGNATLSADMSAHLGKKETDARIYVDVCANLERVWLVEGGVDAPARADGCERREVSGVFVVRPVTTLLVDVAAGRPALWLRQGPVPKEWLGDEQPGSSGSARAWRKAPTRLVLFGGGGGARYSDTGDVMCGTASKCTANDMKGTYAAGGDYWFNQYVAVGASYLRPGKLTADGSGGTYSFNGSLDVQLLTIAGKVGVPVGPVRIYGIGGANYHRGTFSTTETINPVTVTVDGVDQTFPGGTQAFVFRTAGWGWLFGGGFEGWLTRTVAVYAEGGRAEVKGGPRTGGEGELNERLTFLAAGVKLHLGRK